MARPTPSEVAQVYQAVSNWIASHQSALQSTLRRFAPLLVLQPPCFNVAATYTQAQQRMRPRHERSVEIPKNGENTPAVRRRLDHRLVAQNDENKAVFEKEFGGIQEANFAIAGDTRIRAGILSAAGIAVMVIACCAETPGKLCQAS